MLDRVGGAGFYIFVPYKETTKSTISGLCGVPETLQKPTLTGSNPPGSTLIEEYMGFDAVGSKSRSWRTGPGYTGTYRNVQCILCELYTLSLLTRALAQSFVIRGHYPSPLLLGPTNRRARIVRPATGHEGVIDA
jgi:hypothetical protein